MIALILGGAPSVWSELAEAQALLNRRHMVVAANLAGIEFAGRLDGWASLHPEALPKWRAEREGSPAARHFVPGGHALCPWAEKVADRWNGSSGLYAAQVALLELGATAIILCGVPMDSGAGHFVHPGSWAGTADYRLGFEAALRECGGRVRSMDGWTATLFGKPSAAWLGAVENIKPLGASAHHHARIADMHTIKNVGKVSAKFWAKDEAGQMSLHHLAPGETVDAEIDPNQPKFNGGCLAVKPVGEAPKKVAVPKRKAKASGPAPKKPAPPAEPAPEGA